MNEQNFKTQLKLTAWNLMHAGLFDSAVSVLLPAISENGTISLSSPKLDREIFVEFIFLHCGMRDFARFETLSELVDYYYQLKFNLRRIDFALPEKEQLEALKFLQEQQVPPSLLSFLIDHSMLHPQLVRRTTEIQSVSEAGSLLKAQDVEQHRKKDGNEEILFSFIVCVNHPLWYEEMRRYIDALNYAKQYGVEVVPVYHAKSMAEGYNRGMKVAKGVYKIYLHQDVFLCNKNLLIEIKEFFENHRDAGMLGVAGTKQIPNNGIWWETEEGTKKQKLYIDVMGGIMNAAIPNENLNFQATALDGVFLATAVDLPWREDLFTGFHFYDISQSFEMRKKGYSVYIPDQAETWCLHEQSCNKELSKAYDDERKIFIECYLK